jgi:NTE family protein
MKFTLFNMAKPYRIGLALSGGAARGVAHLGVVKALYEKDIRPDCIAGTSIGAIFGALLADGHDPEKLLKIFLGKRMVSYMGITFGKIGLLKMSGLRSDLDKHLKAKTFEELKVPLFITGTNLNSGKVEYFSQGDLVDKVIASASIPGLFAPVRINDALYADGGILDNLPVSPLKAKCRKIIGVHVNYTGPVDEIGNAMSIVERAFHLSIGARISEIAKNCDMFIEPEELQNYRLMDMSVAQEMFDIGYKKAKKMLEESRVFK